MRTPHLQEYIQARPNGRMQIGVMQIAVWSSSGSVEPAIPSVDTNRSG